MITGTGWAVNALLSSGAYQAADNQTSRMNGILEQHDFNSSFDPA